MERAVDGVEMQNWEEETEGETRIMIREGKERTG